MKIGQWIQRHGGKWHRVESVVAGDAITTCGRRMRNEIGFEASDVKAEPACKQCG